MVRPLIFLSLLILASCGDDPAPPAPRADKPAPDAPSPPATPAPAAPTAEEKAGSADAAEVLRSYYALIESGDYEGAVGLRSDGKTDAKRLADNFRAYDRYSVQVGRPSRPSRAGDYLFVDVPVMITGAFKGGKTFGSGGRVTMRRAVSQEAGEADGAGWRVYTG